MMYIYGLLRESDSCLVYVGKTSNPRARMTAHRATTLRGEADLYSMEFFECGESLTVDDEMFWISYMAGLGCNLRNRVGINSRRVRSHRSGLESMMAAKRVRPEKIAVKCDLPLGAVLLVMKGKQIAPERMRKIAKFFKVEVGELR